MKGLSTDKEFEELKILTFAFHFDNYFIESEDGYKNIILKVLSNIFSEIEIKNKSIIIHDNVNVKNNRKFESQINSYIRDKF